MSRAYSNDLRIRIIEAVESGMTQKEAAIRLSVHENTAGNICMLHRKTGSVEPKKPVGVGRPSKVDDQKLIEIYNENPDTHQYEAASMLGVSQSMISRRLKKLGITQKKRA